VAEQLRCNLAIQARLKRHNVIRWAEDFIETLMSLQEEQERLDAKHLGPSSWKRLKQDFRESKRRLILLDYDGTLVPLAMHPDMAAPSDELRIFLGLLAREPGTDVVIVSGRNKNELSNWLGGLDIGLVAEHGVWVKEKGEEWKMIKPLSNEWKPKVLPLMEMYADRLPGSFVEEKDYSLAWHYRMADPEMASAMAKELVDGLVSFTANIDIHVLKGNKVVEVRNAGLTKGDAARYWMSKDDFDFILAAGDDWTDEDLFRVLPETAFSIRIGMTQSYAHYNLRSCSEFLELAKGLTMDDVKALKH
jgi:trehalose 6-phosphate synthase/phosphatase